MSTRVMIIVGSVRPGRVGLPVAEWARDLLATDDRFDVDFVDLAALGLPFMDEPNHPRLRQYTQALADYRQLPDAGLAAERKMLQCMLRERVQPAPLPLDCYAEASRRFAAGQAAPGRDPNYVMALLLARDPQGPRLAAELLAATPAGPQREINAMLFQDFDRDRYLRSVLP